MNFFVTNQSCDSSMLNSKQTFHLLTIELLNNEYLINKYLKAFTDV